MALGSLGDPQGFSKTAGKYPVGLLRMNESHLKAPHFAHCLAPGSDHKPIVIVSSPTFNPIAVPTPQASRTPFFLERAVTQKHELHTRCFHPGSRYGPFAVSRTESEPKAHRVQTDLVPEALRRSILSPQDFIPSPESVQGEQHPGSQSPRAHCLAPWGGGEPAVLG